MLENSDAGAKNIAQRHWGVGAGHAEDVGGAGEVGDGAGEHRRIAMVDFNYLHSATVLLLLIMKMASMQVLASLQTFGASDGCVITCHSV